MVTGLGAVSAAGWGVTPLRRALRSGLTLIAPFDRLDHARQRTHVAGQVPSRPRGWTTVTRRPETSPSRIGSRSSPRWRRSPTRELALPLDGARVGVFFGSTTGGLYETEQYLEVIVERPGSRPPRSLLVSHSLGAPAEAVARHLGVEGPVETVSSACCSGGLAIEQALRAVRSGEVDIALAGGADVLCLTTYSGFNALRAVAEGPCRPFRADRSGMSLGEGGATLVLESLDHLRSRAGRALVELLGAGSSCDASHMTAPRPDGLGAASAIERSLQDSGIGPGDVDLINAHATGTPLNDAAESRRVRARVRGPGERHSGRSDQGHARTSARNRRRHRGGLGGDRSARERGSSHRRRRRRRSRARGQVWCTMHRCRCRSCARWCR